LRPDAVIFSSLLIAILATGLVATFITQPLRDEVIHHEPMARNLTIESIFSPGSAYSSAYPPLPYVFGNLAWRLNPSLRSLRLLNLAVFLAVILIFRLIALKISASPGFLTLLFAMNPYLLKASFTYLMYNWGVLFALAGLYLYFFQPGRFLPLAHLLLGMAVLSQQWLLAVVAAILLHEFVKLRRREIGCRAFSWRVLLKALFLLPAAFLFWSWRGLVHPNFASHSLHPTFEHLNAVLATLGLALAFLVAAHWRRIARSRPIALVFLLPLLWLAIPAHSQGHGLSVITGITSQLAVKGAVLLGAPYKVTMFAFILIGLASLFLLISPKKQDLQQVMNYSLLGLIAAFAASSRLAASHIFACLPFAWLALSDEIENMGWAKHAMIAQFIVITIVYSVYIVFFRSRGVMF